VPLYALKSAALRFEKCGVLLRKPAVYGLQLAGLCTQQYDVTFDLHGLKIGSVVINHLV